MALFGLGFVGCARPLMVFFEPPQRHHSLNMERDCLWSYSSDFATLEQRFED